VNIIADYDANALAAPQSFRDGIQTAIDILNAKFLAPITVKIRVGYGEFNGGALPNQNTSEGGFSGGVFLSYSTLRADLIANSDIDGSSSSLPNTNSVNGVSSLFISPTQERIFGLLPAVNNTNTDDGSIGMGTNFTGNVLIAGALHEITHALARVDGQSSLALFRFTSVGNRDFSNAIPGSPSYFSMNNGNSDIANFGQNSDPGDFLNDALTGNDPFNEIVGDFPGLTAIDIEIMDALGFRTTVPIPPLGPRVPLAPQDMTNDGRADTVFRDSTNGALAVWAITNGNQVSSGYVNINGTQINPGLSFVVAGVGDTNNDGRADIILRNTTNNQLVVYRMNGSSQLGAGLVTDTNGQPIAPDMSYNVVGVDDLNGDGAVDIIWRSTSGALAQWSMDGALVIGSSNITSGGAAVAPDLTWNIVGLGDFNHDGKGDILWRNSITGETSLWAMNGGNIIGGGDLSTQLGNNFTIAGIGDFNGDHNSDILWRAPDGSQYVWLMNGSQIIGSAQVVNNVGQPVPLGSNWNVVEIGDFTGDGKSDIMWRDSNTGQMVEWALNGATIISSGLPNQNGFPTSPPPTVVVQNDPHQFA
jgi:hypothetical protein